MVHRHRALQQVWLTCRGAYADAVPGGVGIWPAGHRFSSSATASTLDRTAESGTQPSGAVWRARPTRPDQKWLYIQPKAGSGVNLDYLAQEDVVALMRKVPSYVRPDINDYLHPRGWWVMFSGKASEQLCRVVKRNVQVNAVDMGLDLTIQDSTEEALRRSMSRIGNLTVRDRLRSAVLTVSGESKANSGIGLKAIADFFMSKYEMASRGSEVEHHPGASAGQRMFVLHFANQLMMMEAVREEHGTVLQGAILKLRALP